MQVHDVVAIGDVCDADQIVGAEQERALVRSATAERTGVREPEERRVSVVAAGHKGTRPVDLSPVARRGEGDGHRRVAEPKRCTVGVAHARAVELIGVAEVLVVAAEAEVIREVPVRRRSADFKRSLVIIRRPADPQIDVGEPGIRPGADDLIDEPGEAVCLRIGWRNAGVDLKLLLTERRGRARRVIIEGAINGDAVDLVSDLVVVAAADAERWRGADITDLIRQNEHAGNRRDRRPGAVEVTAAADGGDLVLLRRCDRVHVRDGTGFDQRRGSAGCNAADRPKDAPRGDVDRTVLVRDHGEARLRDRFVPWLLERERVRVWYQRQEVELSVRVCARVRNLRRTRDRDQSILDRCAVFVDC